MKSISNYLCCLMGLAVPVLFNACSYRTQPQEIIQPDGYELFVKAIPKYPNTMVIYRNSELMKKATPDCPIYICLSQQRGRLYVDGKVAADWPVSTGTSNHPTPTGTFPVLEKKKDYTSHTWGKIFDAEGKCVNSNANTRSDSIPEGGKFEGSPMPNWHRMTATGIGMHTGRVRAGRQLSHGCIRTPGRMASELYSITATGRTKIIVNKEVEACYPTFVGTVAEQQARMGKTIAAQKQPTPAEQLVVVPAPSDPPVAQQQPMPAEQLAPAPVAEQPAPAEQKKQAPVAQQQPTPAEQLAPAPVAKQPAPAEQKKQAPVAQQPAPEEQQPAPAEQKKPTSTAQSMPTPVAQQQPTPAAQSPRTYTRSAGGVKVHFVPAPH